jgi:hypothetical protein
VISCHLLDNSKVIALSLLEEVNIRALLLNISFGIPSFDFRYHRNRILLLSTKSKEDIILIFITILLRVLNLRVINSLLNLNCAKIISSLLIFIVRNLEVPTSSSNYNTRIILILLKPLKCLHFIPRITDRSNIWYREILRFTIIVIKSRVGYTGRTLNSLICTFYLNNY